MKLYAFPPSPNARKVAAVVAHLHLTDVEYVLVKLHKGEHRRPDFLAINPMGKVPVLCDGDLILWESNAIFQYLAKRAGDTSFFPADPKIRASIARWLFWEAGTWSPVIDVFTDENVRKPMLGIGTADPKRVADAEERFRPLAKLLNDQLAERKFLLGDSVTLADFCSSPGPPPTWNVAEFQSMSTAMSRHGGIGSMQLTPGAAQCPGQSCPDCTRQFEIFRK